MKHRKCLVAFLLASLWAGGACAYPMVVYQERMVVQQPVLMARTGTVVVQPPPRQRRFVMPPSGQVYQRGGPQYVAPANAPKPARMTLEERRALRQQINDANRGIYYRNGARVVQP